MKKVILSLVVLATVLVSCKNEKKNATEMKENVEMNSETTEKVAVANIQSKSDSNVTGTITFTQKDGKVSMKAELSGLTVEGEHAIHIHAIGDCSAADGSSAGGHWNPTEENHGKWEHSEFHKGDIGNLVTDAEGNATITTDTDLWCIDCEDVTKNIVGKSVVVHAAADDFTSQPSGAAGARVGCGEIVLQ